MAYVKTWIDEKYAPRRVLKWWGSAIGIQVRVIYKALAGEFESDYNLETKVKKT